MYEINKRIREEMERQHLNNTDLARLSGLNRSSISRYVSDTIEPKQNAIGAIAKALKVSPSFLLGFSEDRGPVIDVDRLTDSNKMKLQAYYQALLDTQEADNGNT